MVRSAVWTNTNTGVRTENLYRPVVQTNSCANLFPAAARAKSSIATYERNLADCGHASANCYQVLFGHTNLYVAGWEFLGKNTNLGRFCKIGAQGNYVRVFLT